MEIAFLDLHDNFIVNSRTLVKECRARGVPPVLRQNVNLFLLGRSGLGTYAPEDAIEYSYRGGSFPRSSR